MKIDALICVCERDRDKGREREREKETRSKLREHKWSNYCGKICKLRLRKKDRD